MFVKDYDLIRHIDHLFEKKRIIYGAGYMGRRVLNMLKAISLDIQYFVDRDERKKSCDGYPVILPQKLYKEKLDDCIIIIASNDYREEIVRELQAHDVNAYICTWYGFRHAIEFNIENDRFPADYQKEFITSKRLWQSMQEIYLDIEKKLQITSRTNPVLVYQPGKVGSSTIVSTLNHYGVENIHIHNISRKMGIEAIDASRFLLEEKIKRCGGTKIISLVREPIGRDLSQFMQYFFLDFVLKIGSGDICECAISLLDKLAKENYQFAWFDKEIRELTGIDIYDYPFDREKGYCLIKKDNTQILILKLEKLHSNVDVLGSFLGITDMKLVDNNVGKEKGYKYIYQGLREEIRIPQRIIDYYYNGNKKMDHFYSEEEKSAFLRKWTAL